MFLLYFSILKKRFSTIFKKVGIPLINNKLFWIVAFATILILIWFYDGTIMGGAEGGLIFYNPQKIFNITSQSWTETGLGDTVNIGVAGLPLHWFLGKLQLIGVPNFFLQAFFFWILLVVSGFSIFWISRLLFPRIDEKFSFIAAIFYWFNPTSFANAWNRNLYNFMVFFTLLPLLLLLFLRGIKKKRYLYAIAIGEVSAVFSYALTSTPFSIVIWILFSYITVFYIFTEERREKIFLVKFFLLSLLSYIAINFWWIEQLLVFVKSPAFNTRVSSFFTQEGNVATLTALSERLGNLTDIARLVHATVYTTLPQYAEIYLFPGIVLLNFIFTTLLFWVIYKLRRNRTILFIGGLFFLGLFLSKGNNPPFGELFQTMFERLSFFQVFRNPFEKFGYLGAIASSLLLPVVIQQLVSKFPSKQKLILGSFLFYILIILGFPYWTGLIFTRVSPEDKTKSISLKVSAPEYYNEANKWLSLQGNDFRILTLPLGGEGMIYTWDKPYEGVEITNMLIDTPGVSFNSTIPLFYDYVSKLSDYQLSPKLMAFLPFMNGKYIMLRPDINFKNSHVSDPEVTRTVLDKFLEEGVLKKQAEIGKLSIYQVGDKWFWPKIYVDSNLIQSNEQDLSKLSELEQGFPSTKLTVVNYNPSDAPNQLLGTKLVLKPEKVFLPTAVSTLSQLPDQEILARLFYSKYLPTDPRYRLSLTKEMLETPPTEDLAGWVLYEMGILGKRTAEIFRLYQQNADKEVIRKSEDAYSVNLQRLGPVISGVIDGRYPVSQDVQDVVRDSIVYQNTLLRRVKSRIADSLLVLQILPKHQIDDQIEGTKKNYFVAKFLVPVSQKYNLISDLSLNNLDIYLDGKLLNESGKEDLMENKGIYIDQGTHEIAVFNPGLVFNSKELDVKELVVDKTRPFKWNTFLPETPGTYSMQFDYRFKVGKSFKATFIQNIDDPNTPLYVVKMEKEPLFHDWKHWDAQFTTSTGAFNGELRMGPVQELKCSKILLIESCKKEDSDFLVEIKNLKLERTSVPTFYLTAGAMANKVSDTSVNWKKINSTLYELDINKYNNQEEMLVFSELFNSNWSLVDSSGKAAPYEGHFLVNDFANGWLIDKSGNYKFFIKFAPQEFLETSKKISVILAVIGILIMGLMLKRRRV